MAEELFTTSELVEIIKGKEFPQAKKGEESLHLTKDQADAIVKCVISEISSKVADGSDVRLNGFGTFKKVVRKERQGRNPQTKELITIPSQTTISFKIAKPFKDILNTK